MMQDGAMSHFQKVCLKTRTIDSFFKLQKYIKSALIIRQRLKLLSYRKSTVIIYYFENIFCGNVNNLEQIDRTFYFLWSKTWLECTLGHGVCLRWGDLEWRWGEVIWGKGDTYLENKCPKYVQNNWMFHYVDSEMLHLTHTGTHKTG